MKQIIKKLQVISGLIVPASLLLVSCNKNVEDLGAPAVPAYPTGTTIAAAIAATPSDSLYSRVITKSGLAPTLNNPALSFTMFVPDNNGMKLAINTLSGGLVPLTAPDAAFSNFISANMSQATCAGIVQYNTIGQKYSSSAFPTTFANYPLPTQIVLDPTQPFVRMPIFPSKRTGGAYLNTMPITAVDQAAANGVIHHTFSLVAPPTQLLAQVIYPDANLSYFTAAIARADSGQVGLNRFDSLLKYGVTNMTILAPNNAAFQALIYQTAYDYAMAASGGNTTISAIQANGAVALGPGIFSNAAFYGILPASTVRGLLAYHILASNATGSYKPDVRAFSVNFSTTPLSFVKTMVNSNPAAALHPGIAAQATFTGPVVSSLQFTGVKITPPATVTPTGTANAVTMDKHAVNGVVHIIDRVLIPQ